MRRRRHRGLLAAGVSVVSAVGGVVGNQLGSTLWPWAAFVAVTGAASAGMFMLEAGWPGFVRQHRVGLPPQPVVPFIDRPALRSALAAGLAKRSATVVLVGNGGTGKTQLAAAVFRNPPRSVTVAVWVSATSRAAVVEAFADAYLRIADRSSMDEPSGRTAEQDTAAFLSWLALTRKRWLVVLDDVADPVDMQGLWPAGRQGRVLVTTRVRDSTMARPGRTTIDVDVLPVSEATALLRQLLAGHPLPDVLNGANDLAEDLGYLPLALTQAAAVIADDVLTCEDYRTALADTARRLDELFGRPRDDYERTVSSTWTLASQLANRREPVGLAVPVLRLAAVLDANGCPSGVLLTDAARNYLEQHRTAGDTSTAGDVDRSRAWAALRSAHAVSLLTCDPSPEEGSLRMHALTQRATLEPLTRTERGVVILAAADAVNELFDQTVDHARRTALLSNAAHLAARHPDPLWAVAHRLLILVGRRLSTAGQVTAATEHLERYLDQAISLRGPDDQDVFEARFFLAVTAVRTTGDAERASALESLLADQLPALGSDHPQVLRTRHNLAFLRGRLGRPEDTIAQTSEVAAARARVLGPDHPDTILSQLQLLSWRSGQGPATQFAAEYEHLLALCRRVMGPRHQYTMWATAGLLGQRAKLGCLDRDAENLLIADYTHAFGPSDPRTLSARHDSAFHHGVAGDAAGAVAGSSAVLADRVRILGPDDPDTLLSRQQLAFWRGETGDLAGAISDYRALIPDLERVLTPEHPLTFSARWRLAVRLGEAGATPATVVHDLLDLLRQCDLVLGQDSQESRNIREALTEWEGRVVP